MHAVLVGLSETSLMAARSPAGTDLPSAKETFQYVQYRGDSEHQYHEQQW